MILYHGTNKKRAKEIFSSGFLVPNAKKIYDYKGFEDINGVKCSLASSDGVYLTPHLWLAAGYAIDACLEETQDISVVFKLDIPCELIEVDSDELRIYFAKKGVSEYNPADYDIDFSMNQFHSVVVKNKLSIFDSNASYLEIPSLRALRSAKEKYSSWSKIEAQHIVTKLKNRIKDGEPQEFEEFMKEFHDLHPWTNLL